MLTCVGIAGSLLSVSQQTCLHVLSESAFLEFGMRRTSSIDYVAVTEKRHAKLKTRPYMRRLGELPWAPPRVLPAVLPAVLPRALLQQGPLQPPLFLPRRVLLRQGAEAALRPGAEAAGAPEVEAVSSLGVGALAKAPRVPQAHRLQRAPVGRLALQLPMQRQPRPKRAQHPLRGVQVRISGLVS